MENNLFSDLPVTALPDDTLCDAEPICGHRLDCHADGVCGDCVTNKQRGFMVAPKHVFVPRKLAGGALNPNAERVAYERSLRA